MAKRGKRYTAAAGAVKAAGGPLALEQAAGLVKQTAKAKFDESVDIDLRLGVDPRHADQMVRGSVSLPHGTGKTVRVLVLASEGKQQEARDAGADHVGLEDLVDRQHRPPVRLPLPDVVGQHRHPQPARLQLPHQLDQLLRQQARFGVDQVQLRARPGGEAGCSNSSSFESPRALAVWSRMSM